MCKSRELLSQMQKLGAELVAQYNYLKTELARCEYVRQDILHKIEGGSDLTSALSYNYAKSLKLISERRRELKNELKAIEPHMKSLTNYYLTSGAVLGQVEKEYDKLANRTIANYCPRVLNLDDNILVQVKEFCGVE